MNWIAQICRRILHLGRRSELDNELAEEMRHHLALKSEQNLREGMPADEARYAAQREFGNQTRLREESRGSWGWRAMEDLLGDVRFAWRGLRKNPGFAAVAVITLALGIGANTAMFSVVNAVLLQPLPYKDSSQIVEIWTRAGKMAPDSFCGIPDSDYIRRQSKTLATVAAFNGGVGATLAGGGTPQRISPVRVSADFFPLLGIQALAGRVIQSSDIEGSGEKIAVISFSLWRESFGTDSSVVGRSLYLDGIPYTVVGIMPATFDFPPNANLWVPLAPSDAERTHRYGSFGAIARIKQGVSLKEVLAELVTISAQVTKAEPDLKDGIGFLAASIKEERVGRARLPLFILLGAVGFVLLISCANIGNLSLSRGWARRSELAVRTVLGATRGRLIRQLFTESLFVALIGGAGGLLLSAWGVKALRLVLPADTPRLEGLRVDGWTLVFTLAISVLAGILFGMLPALAVSRQNLHGAVQKGGSGTSGARPSPRGRRARRVLVAGEVALALILAIGAALALRTLSDLLSVDLGFRTDHLMVMRLAVPAYKLKQSYDSNLFLRQLIENVKSLPGIENVAAENGYGIQVQGLPSTDLKTRRTANCQHVTVNYFRTLGIPLLTGREFTDDDVRPGEPVAVVNAEFKRRYLGDQNPIGMRLSVDRDAKGNPVYGQIVGVVASVQNINSEQLAVRASPSIYVLHSDRDFMGGADLYVRTSSDPTTLISAIRGQVWALAKDQPITVIQTMDQRVAQATSAPRSRALLLGTFAGLGLVLAVIGIYGVISYSVAQRTHEIGIRMALGANPGDILRIVLSEGASLTIAGILVGIGGALALTRLMTTLLYGVKPTDPLTFVEMIAMVLVVALLACFLPARRAIRVDPIIALRYE